MMSQTHPSTPLNAFAVHLLHLLCIFGKGEKLCHNVEVEQVTHDVAYE